MLTSSLIVLGFSLVLVSAYGLRLTRARPARCATRCGSWPALDIIVAVLNEAHLLEDKFDDLARLDYPEPLRFIIVDGGSTDGSFELAAARCRKDDRFVLLSTREPGKAAQLNAGLRVARTPWVVVTDADARMPQDTLRALLSDALQNDAIGVVGSPVVPQDAHPAEQMHWRLANWMREREWNLGSASMVVGPCYAFRRNLIPELPTNVDNDDVYITWRAGSLGLAIGLTGPVVVEVRAPTTVNQLFVHKARRGIGLVKEVFRFVKETPHMSRPLRVAFLFRVALIALAPAILTSLVIVLGTWLSLMPSVWLAVIAAAIATCMVVVGRSAIDSALTNPIIMVSVLVTAASVSLLLYPIVQWCRSSQSFRPIFRRQA